MRAEIGFQLYAGMGGDRTINRVRELWHLAGIAAGALPSEKTLNRWSQAYGWVERAREYDQTVQQRALEQQIDREAEALERHRALGRAMTSIAARRLVELSNSPGELRPEGVAQLGKVGVDIERLSLGLETERQSVRLELSTTVYHELVAVLDFERVDGELRGRILARFRRRLAESVGDLPPGLRPAFLDEDADAFSQEEAALLHATLDALRAGRDRPAWDERRFPALPPPGHYLADEEQKHG